jgi:hypothetical protein
MNLCSTCAELVRDDLDTCPYCNTKMFSSAIEDKIPYNLKFKLLDERRKIIEQLNLFSSLTSCKKGWYIDEVFYPK